MFKRILVTTDGTALSSKAIDAAIALAAQGGSTLVVLNVVPHYPQSYLEGGMVLDVNSVKRIETDWSDQGQTIVDAVKVQAEAKGVSATAVVVKSDVVSDAILAAVTTHGCDLIVMASHGRRGIQRLLLGSETQHVLTHGSVPVLVLK